MNAAFSSRGFDYRGKAAQAAICATLFWIFTYAVLTARAEMLAADSSALFGLRRVLATSAGALIYWRVLRWIHRATTTGSAPGVMPVIATILPASLLILGVRLGVDQAFYDTPPPLEENLRWVTVWAGYFGMWVAGALALQLRQRRVSEVQDRTRTIVAPLVAAQRASAADLAAWDWLVDECAQHIALAPDTSRDALADHLVDTAGYHMVDDPDGVHNARVDLALCIAARIQSSDKARR